MKATVYQVNKELKRQNIGVEIIKGDCYFWFHSQTFEIESLMTNYIGYLSVEEIVNQISVELKEGQNERDEFDNWMKDNNGILKL